MDDNIPDIVLKISENLVNDNNSAWHVAKTKDGTIWIAVKDVKLNKVFVYKSNVNDSYEREFKESPIVIVREVPNGINRL